MDVILTKSRHEKTTGRALTVPQVQAVYRANQMEWADDSEPFSDGFIEQAVYVHKKVCHVFP